MKNYFTLVTIMLSTNAAVAQNDDLSMKKGLIEIPIALGFENPNVLTGQSDKSDLIGLMFNINKKGQVGNVGLMTPEQFANFGTQTSFNSKAACDPICFVSGGKEICLWPDGCGPGGTAPILKEAPVLVQFERIFEDKARENLTDIKVSIGTIENNSFNISEETIISIPSLSE